MHLVVFTTKPFSDLCYYSSETDFVRKSGGHRRPSICIGGSTVLVLNVSVKVVSVPLLMFRRMGMLPTRTVMPWELICGSYHELHHTYECSRQQQTPAHPTCAAFDANAICPKCWFRSFQKMASRFDSCPHGPKVQGDYWYHGYPSSQYLCH